MKTLREAALDAIEAGVKLPGGNFGYYRNVYSMTYRRRKYVVKVDKKKIVDNGGCQAEAECWEKYKDTKAGSALAPVVAHGSFENGYHWLVMPKLQKIGDVHSKVVNGCRRQANYREKMHVFEHVIYPKVKGKLSKPKWQGDRIACKEFGDDLHWDNWAMNNRGVWFCIDYSEGGNQKKKSMA